MPGHPGKHAYLESYEQLYMTVKSHKVSNANLILLSDFIAISSVNLGLVLGFGVFVFSLTLVVMAAETLSITGDEVWTDFWVVRLLLNLLGYATIIIPAALIIRYFKKSNYDERAGPGFAASCVKMCVYGAEPSLEDDITTSKKSTEDSSSQSTRKQAALLLFCFFGLQGSYLTWGLLQERIMTYKYEEKDGTSESFKNSQFLVFMNRILAFWFAVIILNVKKQSRHTAPLYKYSYCSFSNIMSSWCQYEALKFIAFPTQVLAKASKIIPVMLMGKVVSKKTYEHYEYLTAVMISVGVSLFLLTSQESKSTTVTTFSGVCILIGYMLFDSFTSNWQGELFSQYKMSSIQMMAGVNLFSCLLTITSLLEQGGFVTALEFMGRHPLFISHVVVLSICSGIGQLFIFYTISQFGPVTFTIIMTMRQGFAILLSCLFYNHPMTWLGLVGVLIVFVALFLRIYANQRKKLLRSQQVDSPTNKV